MEGIVLADERKRAVHSAIAKLSEDKRVVIHLIYFEEMTYDEAAKVMKKNRKQVDRLTTFYIVPKRNFASFLERMVSCYYERNK